MAVKAVISDTKERFAATSSADVRMSGSRVAASLDDSFGDSLDLDGTLMAVLLCLG
jgi:hypothetical protein